MQIKDGLVYTDSGEAMICPFSRRKPYGCNVNCAMFGIVKMESSDPETQEKSCESMVTLHCCDREFKLDA